MGEARRRFFSRTGYIDIEGLHTSVKVQTRDAWWLRLKITGISGRGVVS